MIIGSNGAGKTTFSDKLAAITGLPLTHIDKIYWRNHWEITPREEFESKILAEAQKPHWIIEGNNLKSIDQRLQYADTVFWFEFPPLLCTANVLKRDLKYHHKVRPDMPDACISRIDLPLLKIVWEFNQQNHVRIENSLNRAKHVELIRFSNYRQVRQYLSSL